MFIKMLFLEEDEIAVELLISSQKLAISHLLVYVVGQNEISLSPNPNYSWVMNNNEFRIKPGYNHLDLQHIYTNTNNNHLCMACLIC